MKKTRKKTRINKTEREMQVSATSRHCEKNGWGGCLRKSENITKQVHQWEEAIESIPLAKLGDDYGDFLLLWLSVSGHQPHLSCLIWTFEPLPCEQNVIVQCLWASDLFNLFNCDTGHNKSRDSPCWGWSDLAWSPALTPDPPLGAKVLMARATIAAYYLFLRSSSCLDL